MDTRQISFVDIQERDDFDELLRRLSRYAGMTLTIDVASDIDTLSEPGEFETLYSSAQALDIRVELVTDDPVRQEFARIHGMKSVPDSIPARSEIVQHDLSTAAQVPIAEETRGESLEATAEYVLDETQTDWSPKPERFSPFDSDASFSFVTAPPRVDQPGPARAHRSRPRPRRRTEVSRSLGSGSIVVSVVVVAAAIVILMLALLAPSAAVVIVPETRAVSAEVTYGLAGAGSNLDVAVAPKQITETLTFDVSIPTSGEAFVPDAPARGMVFLTNPRTEVLTLPEGTIFTAEDQGVSFTSLEAIEIPAADPFESARFGTAVVAIEAIESGPAGNLDAGELSGTLESGIMFQNRFPLEGGAMKSVGVVTAQDLDALRILANQELGARLSTALDDQIPDGWALVDSPEMATDINYTFSADVDEIADSVAVHATVDVFGAIYDPLALEREARDRLLDAMTGTVPEGFGLVVDSLRISAPQDTGGSILRLSAEGVAEAQFDPGFADRLRNDLVGKSEDSAARMIQEVAGIDHFSVEFGPAWLPWEPVPRLGNRISIEIDGT